MEKIDFEKINSIARLENVLLTITKSGKLYSWGDLGFKRITRACDMSFPRISNLTQRIGRKTLNVKVDRFLPNHELALVDTCDQTWTFVDGIWKLKTPCSTPDRVQFIGYS